MATLARPSATAPGDNLSDIVSLMPQCAARPASSRGMPANRRTINMRDTRNGPSARRRPSGTDLIRDSHTSRVEDTNGARTMALIASWLYRQRWRSQILRYLRDILLQVQRETVPPPPPSPWIAEANSSSVSARAPESASVFSDTTCPSWRDNSRAPELAIAWARSSSEASKTNNVFDPATKRTPLVAPDFASAAESSGTAFTLPAQRGGATNV